MPFTTVTTLPCSRVTFFASFHNRESHTSPFSTVEATLSTASYPAERPGLGHYCSFCGPAAYGPRFTNEPWDYLVHSFLFFLPPPYRLPNFTTNSFCNCRSRSEPLGTPEWQNTLFLLNIHRGPSLSHSILSQHPSIVRCDTDCSRTTLSSPPLKLAGTPPIRIRLYRGIYQKRERERERGDINCSVRPFHIDRHLDCIR